MSGTGQDTPVKRRAYAINASGDLRGAVAALSDAIAEDPRDMNLRLLRGLAFFKLNEHVKAVADFDVVAKANPGWSSIFVHRGEAHLGMGNFDAAIADFSTSIRLEPSLGPLYNNRGMAYEKKGDLESARRDYREAERLSRRW